MGAPPVSRVLLADDNPRAQRMGTEILRQEGFEVLGITDGREVLAAVDRFSPALVLVDVSLPSHSGYEICQHIKTNPALGHVKVILLAGAIEPIDPIEAQRVGADGVLRKPFEPTAVIHKIRELLSGGPAQETQQAEPEELERAVRQALRESSSEADGGIDRERVRAAVILAVESALPTLLDELTERVLDALGRPKR